MDTALDLILRSGSPIKRKWGINNYRRTSKIVEAWGKKATQTGKIAS